MCVVSMVIDSVTDDWKKRLIPFRPYEAPGRPNPYREEEMVPFKRFPKTAPQLTPEEIQKVREMIEAAKEIDEFTGQPDCEMESKKELLLELAGKLGVEIDFI